jgi:hypothetical protein
VGYLRLATAFLIEFRQILGSSRHHSVGPIPNPTDYLFSVGLLLEVTVAAIMSSGCYLPNLATITWRGDRRFDRQILI